MSTRRIRIDDVGPYIVINGAIHRPQVAHVRHKGTNQRSGESFDVVTTLDASEHGFGPVVGETQHEAGDVVSAKIKTYTPYSVVGDETWVSHGQWPGSKGNDAPTEHRYHDGVHVYDPKLGHARWE